MLYNHDPPSPLCTPYIQHSFHHIPVPFGIVCVGYNLITTAFPFSVCVCPCMCVCVCELQSRCCRRADATKYAHLYLHEYCQLQRIIPPRTATKHFRHQTPTEPNRTQPASLLQAAPLGGSEIFLVAAASDCG